MASLPNPAFRPVTVAEFLAMDLGEAKAELIDGAIYMMAGGSARHAAIAANIIAALGSLLRGSGYRPYGSDLAVRTGDASIRFPNVSVYCRDAGTPRDPAARLLGDPHVIFEILSPSTASNDQIIKLAEYRRLAGVRSIVFVDPNTSRVRLADKDNDGAWLEPGSDLSLPSLGITLPHQAIFAE